MLEVALELADEDTVENKEPIIDISEVNVGKDDIVGSLLLLTDALLDALEDEEGLSE